MFTKAHINQNENITKLRKHINDLWREHRREMEEKNWIFIHRLDGLFLDLVQVAEHIISNFWKLFLDPQHVSSSCFHSRRPLISDLSKLKTLSLSTAFAVKTKFSTLSKHYEQLMKIFNHSKITQFMHLMFASFHFRFSLTRFPSTLIWICFSSLIPDANNE